MKWIPYPKPLLLAFCLLLPLLATAQERRHTEKFEQLEYELRDPNVYRNAAGAPGHEYWQNTADYEIEVELNDENQSVTGYETITYHNNSPDDLEYLWVQLDQNMRAGGSHTYSSATNSIKHYMPSPQLSRILGYEFEGGFKISEVSYPDGQPLPYLVNQTMMRVDLPQPLKPGESFSFNIGWSYNINDRMLMGGRSGYEYFEKDDNYLYTIAQFYPRMCVYNDTDGWQNKQFLGSGEFALPFGDFKVKITVPDDHMLGATGKLQNPEEVLTEKQRRLLEKAETAKKPVIIVSQKEAEKAEKSRSTGKKTWVFHADSVRDFAFATSRKFIWDAMGVEVGGKTVMAMSYYPKEGNPLWEEYSTRVVAHTLEVYSKYTFDYPYHKAISVHAARIGMEYPMICFNFGRPDPDGTVPENVKWGMIMVIIHEVGHNFFPMIVNSDERQWTWMDEGLNTFVQYLAEKEWDENYPSRSGPPQNIVPYMKMDKEKLSPIMTNSEQVQNLGPNAYSKPATALNILRETVMGPELFDHAFKAYSQRWAFKHPTPADFFRTMEDASGIDLDWFWRGWFYTVDHVDIALSGVKQFKITDGEVDAEQEFEKASSPDDAFQEFMSDLNQVQQEQVKQRPYFYELTLENQGGLIMPVIVEFTYEDGTKEIHRLPAEVWRRNDRQVSKVFPAKKPVQQVVIDPFMETADTDLENNYWPEQKQPSRFELFKEKGSGK